MFSEKITKEEIKCFIGLMIYSGYAPVPLMHLYWDFKQDLHNDLVSNAMRRNRMYTIKNYIHFADIGELEPHDKIWKLRPLMDKMKERCIANFVATTELLNYDDSMVNFFGRRNIKQFIPGKPIRFGYKMCCLNSSEGYLLNFNLYQGVDPRIPDQFNQLFGKCAAPLVVMQNEFPHSIQTLPFDFFFDNQFIGTNLFTYLKFRGYSATGTFRENRLPKT
ncbi:piggyBac transposable element-derived protein 3-like [Belonocnema kinseyi]|uniref:piggyBac transposable element-derived protein 3-like n=1 Tax=Belonocnema kinseyi TaxID=2817044 RepID=UPI00143D6A90|nr:piggyBac transposable element-derived protein 3-like [Belonocnema kinseyi]